MFTNDKLLFLRTALALRMIDLKEYNEVILLWKKESEKDTGDILLEKKYITEAEYSHIKKTAFGNSIEEKTLGTKEAESIKTGEDLYTESFTLRGIIGHGGAGRVFLGFDKNVEREVAIKEIVLDKTNPEHKKILSRFIREAKITGQLEHPGVVPVYQLNTKEDGTTFYVMKFVRGKTLFTAINECKVNNPELAFKKRMKLLEPLISICGAVGYAHSNDIIHRDIKPGNIVLGEFGETIILDWGLAKKLESNKEKPKHEEQNVLGTPSYMPPEQADGKFGEVDKRSDVYSLGTILFMLLTGEKPYQGSMKEILTQLTSDAPTPLPESINKNIPPELSAICKKAMKKNREERFSDAYELTEELRAYRDGRLVSTYAYTKRELFKRFVARNKTTLSAVAAVLLAIIIGSALAVNFGIEAHRARIKAENALVEVTALSQSSIDVARKSANELDDYFDSLSDDMGKLANQLSTVDIYDNAVTTPKLKELCDKFRYLESLEIILSPGKIIAAYPKGYEYAIGYDVSGQEQVQKLFETATPLFSKVFETVEGFHAVTLQVPIHKDSKIVASLSALIKPEEIIPRILSIDPLKSDYQIWFMQNDGYILYDENKYYVGMDLFTPQIQKEYPELLKFGEEMVNKPWGVGTYIFTDESGRFEMHKIATWNTFTPSKYTEWKIIVSYPYMVKK